MLQEIKYCGILLEAYPDIFIAKPWHLISLKVFRNLKLEISIATSITLSSYGRFVFTICMLMDFSIHNETIEYGTDHCAL